MNVGGLLDIMIAWLPAFILIAVWIYMYLDTRNVYTGRSGKSHGELLEEHVAELRRQNDLLEKIVKDQEARLQRLETRRPSGGGGGSGAGGR